MRGHDDCISRGFAMRAVDRLDEATRQLQVEMAAEAAAFLEATTLDDYQRYLTRTYGLVYPLERCLLCDLSLPPTESSTFAPPSVPEES